VSLFTSETYLYANLLQGVSGNDQTLLRQSDETDDIAQADRLRTG